jgi:hypothetical protein
MYLSTGDRIAEMALHNPQLVKGLAASLRTLIIASFRAPATQFVMALLRKLNPTAQILRARAFCKHHEYIFALLCMFLLNLLLNLLFYLFYLSFSLYIYNRSIKC